MVWQKYIIFSHKKILNIYLIHYKIGRAKLLLTFLMWLFWILTEIGLLLMVMICFTIKINYLLMIKSSLYLYTLLRQATPMICCTERTYCSNIQSKKIGWESEVLNLFWFFMCKEIFYFMQSIIFFLFPGRKYTGSISVVWLGYICCKSLLAAVPPVLNIFEQSLFSVYGGMGSFYTPRINFKLPKIKNNSCNYYTSTVCQSFYFRYQTLVY